MEAEVWGRAIHGEKTIMYKDRLRDTRKLIMFSKLFLMWCSRNKVDQWAMTRAGGRGLTQHSGEQWLNQSAGIWILWAG